jgi:hypothetical protein
VEEVEKDLDSLDEQAQRAAVAADAPELGALLAELRANLAEVRTRVGPLVTEVRVAMPSLRREGRPCPSWHIEV